MKNQKKTKVLCDWCHPKLTYHCSHCGKKIKASVGSGVNSISPHQFHEFCSERCEQIMINNWNF